MSSRKELVVRRIENLKGSISRIDANILHEDELVKNLTMEAEWVFYKGDGNKMRDTTAFGPELRKVLRLSGAPGLTIGGSREPLVTRSGGTKVWLIGLYHEHHRPNEVKIMISLGTEQAVYEAELHKLNAKEGTLAEQLEYVAPELKEAREAAVRQQLALDM